MIYPIRIHERAVRLRKRGYSIKEISERLGIAKGTSSLWLRDVALSLEAQKRLMAKITNAQHKGPQVLKNRRIAIRKEIEAQMNVFAHSLTFDKEILKMLCALIFYCEGSKREDTGVVFVNSDYTLVRCFLELLVACFTIDRKRIKVLLHLHEYHHPQRQTIFWSKVLDIPIEQFHKPYIKPHTGKRIRENYQGCASVRYHDTNLGRQLFFLAQSFIKRYNGLTNT